MSKYKWHVFVSHNHKQKKWVRQFVKRLRDRGLSVFLDGDTIVPGAAVLAALEEGVTKSRFLVFIITPDSVASDWVSLETSLSLHSDPAAREGRLIPVILEPTDKDRIRPAVRQLSAVDLTNRSDRREAYRRLLDHLDAATIRSGPSAARVSSRPAPATSPMNALSEALRVRRVFRGPLTYLACYLYKEAFDTSGVLVLPEGMPVLTREAWLPREPLLLKEIDGRLLWRDEAGPMPRSEVTGNMVEALSGLSTNHPLYDGRLYRVVGNDDQGNFRFCPGSYFAFLNTCDYLSLELARAVAGTPRVLKAVSAGNESQYPEMASLLTASRGLLPARLAAGPFEFDARCTAFGTCALVVIKRTGKPSQLVLNMRSSALSETPDLLHVIPAGTFQPNMSDDRFHRDEFSFTENLVREFVEELLDSEQLRRQTQDVFDYEAMYTGRAKAFRDQVVRTESFLLLYLGTVVDPVNLKPEILTVFMVHEGFLRTVEKGELMRSWETNGTFSFYEFSATQLDRLIDESNLVPTGRAHLMLVRKHYDYLSRCLANV